MADVERKKKKWGLIRSCIVPTALLAMVGMHCSSSDDDADIPDGGHGCSTPGPAGCRDGGSGGVADGSQGAVNDDECPARLDVNCSDTCGSQVNCSPTPCGFGPIVGSRFTVDDVSRLPMVIRTPRDPRMDPACDCTKPDAGGFFIRYYAYVETKDGAGGPVPAVRVRIGAPWKVAVTRPATCPSDAPGSGCAVGKSFIVYPDLGDASNPREHDPFPSRNITIDQAPAEGSPCP